MADPVLLPIFPLGDVVLFPGVRAPLHIFEPRYQQMMEVALEGGRVIGMVAVRPDHADEMAGDPAVFPIGCAGAIERHERLRDGRYNLVLRGIHRFRIAEEHLPDGERLFRLARVEPLVEVEIDEIAAARIAPKRARVARLLEEMISGTAGAQQGPALRRLSSLGDTEFANGLCQALGLPVEDRQALLEASGPAARIDSLEGMLSFHLARMRSPHAPGSDRVH
jgi:Lon protease-like protein